METSVVVTFGPLSSVLENLQSHKGKIASYHSQQVPFQQN